MSDPTKLEETVNQILQNAISSAQQGTEFLKDQIPDVVKQLLLWKTCDYAISLTLCVLWAILLFWKVLPCMKRLYDWDDDGFPSILASAAVLITSGIAIVGFFASLYDFIQIIAAPKVWLLEYAASLVHR